MSNTEIMGPLEWSRSNWRGIARATAISFGWFVVMLPLVLIFVVSAQTAFDYYGAQPPSWFGYWVGLSLMVVLTGPILYIARRELKPEGEND